MQKGQSAIEFLSTYSFSFLIIAIVLALLLFFSVLPKATLPLECTFYSGFNCVDNAYFNTSNGGAQLVVLATDTQPGIMNITSFNAVINYAQSVNGFCVPNLVTSGQKVHCVANLSNPGKVGALYTGTFQIAGKYCANSPGTLSILNCTSGAPLSFGGTIQTEGALSSNSLNFLAYPQDIYCVGSNAGGKNQVYYAPISTTGIGQWVSVNSFPIQMTSAGCSIYNNYIYCVGSNTGSRTQTYYAPISASGVGQWKSTKAYPIQITSAGCSTYNGQIYCVGSKTGGQVYYAPVTSSGIGTWISTNSYPLQLNSAGCALYNNYIYCVGSNTGGDNQAYYAPILSSSIVGNWVSTTSYPIGLTNAGCSIYNQVMYCIGSQIGSDNQVYYAPVSSSGIGNWIATTGYPVAINNAGCVTFDGYIYCIGSNSGGTNQVYYARILNPGIGNWTASNTYPVAMQNAYCAVPGYSGGYLGGGGGVN